MGSISFSFSVLGQIDTTRRPVDANAGMLKSASAVLLIREYLTAAEFLFNII